MDDFVFALLQKTLLQDLYVEYCTQLSRNIIFTLPKTRGKLEKEMAMHATISSPFIWRNFDKVKFITTLWDSAVEVSQPPEQMVG